MPAATANLAAIDRVSAKRQLRMAINLPFRNRAELDTLLQQLYDPSSPSFHHFLTSEEFTAAFGPTKEDYQAVMDFVRSQGLTSHIPHAPIALWSKLKVRSRTLKKLFTSTCAFTRIPRNAVIFSRPDVEPSP